MLKGHALNSDTEHGAQHGFWYLFFGNPEKKQGHVKVDTLNSDKYTDSITLT